MRLTARLSRFVILSGILLGSVANAQNRQPIRIGVLSDFSGIFKDFTSRGSEVGAQMAVDEFGGTVLGRPVEVVIGDHQNKPDIGSAIVRRWFDNEGVEMVTDVIGSSVALAVQSVIREKKKIAMYSGAGAVDLFGKSCAPGGFLLAGHCRRYSSHG